jgi:UDP-N-acetylmuramoyl-L-alanyl-D-glutamate--2,6-diaminopimelate ligase
MRLVELLKNISYMELHGSVETDIGSIETDSRKIRRGGAFIACRGMQHDGHQFIPEVLKSGAKAVFCEIFPSDMPDDVTFIKVADSVYIAGELASAFYDFPSEKMKVVGITGTNGKTSIATLLYRLFISLGYKTGLISTISYIVNKKEEIATQTTPDPLKIQQLMFQMVMEGCQYCFMEVSSHAIQQYRIGGIIFAGGVFTNITHDHLDYHNTFVEYLRVKKRFFDQLPPAAFALINIDDKNGRVMAQNTKAKVITYSNRSMADFRCKVLECHFNGMLLSIGNYEVWTRFVGNFNASNLLAVYAVAVTLKPEEDRILAVLSNLEPVRGRFETIRSMDGRLAVVDYAHTPDALKNVLNAITGMRSGNEQVITVIGAGGDRDRTKRPEMAREAVVMSDKVILTSDNPRSEDPAGIIKDMEAGIEPELKNKAVTIENRREAIKTAALIAKPGDIILIAGKGHEDYQEVKGVRRHFDDAEEIKKCFGVG